jgi:hypothetical protein
VNLINCWPSGRVANHIIHTPLLAVPFKLLASGYLSDGFHLVLLLVSIAT